MIDQQTDDYQALWLPLVNRIQQIFPSMEQSDISRALDAVSLVQQKMIGRHCGDLADKLLQYLSVVHFIHHSKSQTVNCIEIGTLFGGSCLMKLLALRDYETQGQVVCIDPMSGYYNQDLDPSSGLPVTAENLFENLNRFGFSNKLVDLRQFYSDDPKARTGLEPDSIAILMIDGDHTLQGVTSDWKHFHPLVMSGGIVLIDDYLEPAWPDITLFANQLLSDLTEGWMKLGQLGTTLMLTRSNHLKPEEDPQIHTRNAPTVKQQDFQKMSQHKKNNHLSSADPAATNIDEIHPSSNPSLEKFKDLHTGERCVIIGNGPSLNEMDLSILKDEITFGLNRIYLGFENWDFRPDYYISVNSLVLEQHAEEILEHIQAPKFISYHGLPYFPKDREDVIFLKSLPDPIFSKEPGKGVWEGYTVTYVAMQLAFFMGFEEVILIGVDHNFVTQGPANAEVLSQGDDPNHFAKDYFGKGARWHLPDLHNSEMAYRLAKQVFENHHRQILDATVGGKLTVFPKVNYETYFRNPTYPLTNPSELDNLPEKDHQVVVYQMGKVGSSSITDSLKAQNYDQPVHQVHYLTDQGIQHFQGENPQPEHIKNSLRLKDWIKDNKNQRPISYISLIRDPVSRNISAFFQNLNKWISEDKLSELDKDHQVKKLEQLFLDYYAHETPLEWIDQELTEFTGFNVYESEFPVDQGYQIFQNKNHRLLLIRTEDLSTAGVNALKNYLDLDEFALQNTNTASSKWYAELYAFFTHLVTLPEWYLDRMYNSKYAQHFYSEQEIEAFRSRWSGKSPLMSLILPTGEEWPVLENCLRQLRSQTIAERMEIILIEQGVNKPRHQLPESLVEGFAVATHTCLERENTYDAWNLGALQAAGDFIIMLKPQDKLQDQALEFFSEALLAHPEADLSYADFTPTSDPHQALKSISRQDAVETPLYKRDLALMVPIFGPHAVYRKSVLENVGLFNNKYRSQGEFDFQLRLTAAGALSVKIPLPLSLAYQPATGDPHNELDGIRKHKRSQIPLPAIFKYDPRLLEDEAAAWTALGNRAVKYDHPYTQQEESDLGFAIDCFQKALKCTPDFYPALHNLIVLLGSVGQWQEAQQLLQSTGIPPKKDLFQAVSFQRLLPLIPVSASLKFSCLEYLPDDHPEKDQSQFTFNESINQKNRRKEAEALLQKILDSENPLATLTQNEANLDIHMLEVLEETIQVAAAEGKEQLVNALNALSNYISEIIENQNQMIDSTTVNPPVFIYQMGKVGSSSIRDTLKKYFPGKIIHSHNYQDMSKSEQEFFINRKRNQKTIKIITPVRDPISRNISSFFQNFHRDTGHNFNEKNWTQQQLKKLFLDHYPHNICLEWFDYQFLPVFDINVYNYTFPKKQKYSILQKGIFDILIFRTDLDRQVQLEIISDFLDCEINKWVHTNISAEKEYGTKYKHFTKHVKLPKIYLTIMTKSRFCRHFWTDDEISSMIHRWEEKSEILVS